MLSMTDETRAFLAERCSDIPQDREHLNDLLDFLDALMVGRPLRHVPSSERMTICITATAKTQ